MSNRRVLLRLIGAIGVGVAIGCLLAKYVHPIAAVVLAVVLIAWADIAEWRLDREVSKE